MSRGWNDDPGAPALVGGRGSGRCGVASERGDVPVPSTPLVARIDADRVARVEPKSIDAITQVIFSPQEMGPSPSAARRDHERRCADAE
jgi:hypothetical protein